MGFLDIFEQVFISVLRIAVVTGIGVLLMHTKVTDREFQMKLGNIIFNIFLPTFLVANLIQSLTLSNASAMAVIVLYFVVFGLTAAALSYSLMRCFFRIDANLRKVLTMSCTFQNAGALPLAVAQIAPLGGPENNTQAISYVSIYLTCNAVFFWTIGYAFLQGSGSNDEDSLELVELAAPSDESEPEENSLGQDQEETTLDKSDSKHEIVLKPSKTATHSNNKPRGWRGRYGDEDNLVSAEEKRGIDIDPEDVVLESPLDRIVSVQKESYLKTMWLNLKDTLRRIPGSVYRLILAMLFGCVLGLIPATKAKLTDPESIFFKLVTQMFSTVGEPLIVTSLFVLGANLYSMSLSKMSVPLLVTVVSFKLIFAPFLAYFLNLLFIASELIPKQDKILQFVLLLENCSPTAINMSLICQLLKIDTREISFVQFFQYISSAFSLTILVSLFIYLLDI